ncbi:MAG TPA: D-cysteine desulfhydrase family protein [Caulobacteraceae bacterium]|nr:D-cysteine desulfhydrase family protein [Caulobacteraceae bacterium]
MRLQDAPRIKLAHLPTPLEPLLNLSRRLGGPSLYIKRDDCTGLGLGGNKVRKLEFVLAEALNAGADMIVTWGSVQSNHARQTAAACAKLGLPVLLLLMDNGTEAEREFYRSGNVLIDRLFNAEIRTFPDGGDADAYWRSIEGEYRAAGKTPFFIPVGASTPVGCLGYAVAAAEIAGQGLAAEVSFDKVFCAAGSLGTQAGLICGFHLIGWRSRVIGLPVAPIDRPGTEDLAWSLVQQTCDLLACQTRPSRADVVVNDFPVEFGAYASIENVTLEAMKLVAETEGIVLDPIYTGPAMAGLIDAIRRGSVTPDETVLFVHTGGVPGAFGYLDRYVDRLSANERASAPASPSP